MALLLGSVGVLVMLGLMAALGWSGFQLTSTAQAVAAQIEQRLVQAEARLNRLVQLSDPILAVVDKARAVAAKVGQRLPTLAEREEFEEARSRLIILAEMVDLPSDVLSLLPLVLDEAAHLIEKSGDQAQGQRLNRLALDIRDAARELESVRALAAKIHPGGVALTGRKLDEFAQQIQTPMVRVVKALKGLMQESVALRKKLPEWQQALHHWNLIGVAIGSGLLLWGLLSQLAMVAWGRRWYAAKLADSHVAEQREQLPAPGKDG